MQQYIFFISMLALVAIAAHRLIFAIKNDELKRIYGVGKFHPPVSPVRFRGCDKFGCGYYGASRDGGTRTHMGTDIIAAKGQPVYAPISGLIYQGPAYASGKHPELRMVRIKGDKLSVNIMYVSAATSGYVLEGDLIGYAQTLQAKYPGIHDHIHFEVLANGVKIDPKPYLV
jgi:murein DD-endopeptidase MepM/ murein hydrolase activator NlpD